MFFIQRVYLQSSNQQFLGVCSRWRRLWARRWSGAAAVGTGALSSSFSDSPSSLPSSSSSLPPPSSSSSSFSVPLHSSRGGTWRVATPSPDSRSTGDSENHFRCFYPSLSPSTTSPSSTSTISYSSPPAFPPSPQITIIPTLHVASISFYDSVLRYIESSVKQYGDHSCILLEGICDGEEDAEVQRQEYFQIANNPSLQEMLRKKAEENTVFSTEVQKEICAELGVEYPILLEHQVSVRLQECYLKPKLAASFGLHLHNEADMNMKEVQAVLRAELEAEAAKGSTAVPSTVSVRQIGQFPRVRHARELKVARAALERCQLWLAQEEDGEVVIPWGLFHAEPIVRVLQMGLSTTTSFVPPLPGVSSTDGKGSTTGAGPGTTRMEGSMPSSNFSTSPSPNLETVKNSVGIATKDGQLNTSHMDSNEEELLWIARSLPVYFEEDRAWTRTVPFGIPEGILSSNPMEG